MKCIYFIQWFPFKISIINDALWKYRNAPLLLFFSDLWSSSQPFPRWSTRWGWPGGATARRCTAPPNVPQSGISPMIISYFSDDYFIFLRWLFHISIFYISLIIISYISFYMHTWYFSLIPVIRGFSSGRSAKVAFIIIPESVCLSFKECPNAFEFN